MSRKDIEKRANKRHTLAIIASMVIVIAICGACSELSEFGIKEVLQMMLAMLLLWVLSFMVINGLADAEEDNQELRERLNSLKIHDRAAPQTEPTTVRRPQAPRHPYV